MKKSFYTFILGAISLFSISVSAQDSEKANALWVHDTRDVNEPPSYFKGEIRADLKKLITVGISMNYGFSTNLTISPWSDSSAGYNHQLNFNNEGILYRNGDIDTPSWNGWNKILMSDLSGNVNLEKLKVTDSFEFGNELDNTNSTFIIQGPNSPTGEASKRDIIFNFKNAGQSGIRAFRGDEWGTFLQLMTSQPKDATGMPRVRMHIDQYGKIGVGTVNPSSEFDVNGTISSHNLLTSGSIGIGTVNTEGYKLAVNGIIRAKEIKVESDWADFVFKKDYKLPTLKEVETHINENGTLPGIPSEAEVKANGVNLAETNALLLQKIEELTLYIIQQEKRMESMEAEIKSIRSN
ncbi:MULTISPECIES: hypothetical protein [Bacteroides]|uniref:hypothetical protein n=1 Tax=Bacteroides TaxID=816 RepID=UPI001F23D923|nr:hypothetical protein [Bacteroides nordii]MCE8463664.1 hypothetical protein [Bacteroides nordii]UYU49171.1 hypothetical protein KQP55_00800 [Bacteroides nordii]